ncbi:multicopper oxidase-domain-containing protein [Xylogone sp. PMI_703]|nr:multicopper oxidase-domain-containing protein [Xylogone sp. PMI_703]
MGNSMGALSHGVGGGVVPNLIHALPQHQTNGLSPWGTFQAPSFPKFLQNNPSHSGFPWGQRTAHSSNPYTETPSTGVIRYYNFTIERGVLAPDGYQKSVILINGQFPGPVIEANWGDTIEVEVHNKISGPEEGTSLHWHGLLQKSSPWMDGVPGVQQCPIAPGSSFTYKFQADLYGTSWYHSHYSAQYAGGLMGPMVIHGPSHVDYDIDVGPVFLSDWCHAEYFSIIEKVVGNGSDANPAPKTDNNLINGKMNFDCSTVAANDTTPCTDNAGISQFRFSTGKTHRLRLVNGGAEGIQRFSIDGHTMTVVANDMVPIKPYTAKVVTLAPGQRSDVLVIANAGSSNSAFWMRSNISEICSLSNQGKALAAIYYDKADTTKAPTSTPWDVPDPGTCTNDDLSLTVPYYPIAPSLRPSTTRTMEINSYVNETGNFLWTLDDVSFRADYNNPVLLIANSSHLKCPDVWNVKDFLQNTTIRVVVNNPTFAAHPMHLHGHNMYILHEGTGNWDGKTITNPQNPQRRDVQLVRPNGHLVWQIDADNPGVWPFHCHIAWHVSAGLYANILERPDKIGTGNLAIPRMMEEACKPWGAYTGRAVVEQIDSGL